MRARVSALLLLLLLLLLPLDIAAGRGNEMEEEPSPAFEGNRQDESGSVRERRAPVGRTGLDSGNSRKLLTRETASRKRARSQRVQEVAAVPVVAEHDPPATEIDPGVMDIEGMDYSPATRKPPIHN